VLLWVVTPIVVSPILALWVLPLGMGTMKARTPSAKTDIQTKTNERIIPP
jgi:hypothetical protein